MSKGGDTAAASGHMCDKSGCEGHAVSAEISSNVLNCLSFMGFVHKLADICKMEE